MSTFEERAKQESDERYPGLRENARAAFVAGALWAAAHPAVCTDPGPQDARPDWFRSTPESERLLAEERASLAARDVPTGVAEAIESVAAAYFAVEEFAREADDETAGKWFYLAALRKIHRDLLPPAKAALDDLRTALAAHRAAPTTSVTRGWTAEMQARADEMRTDPEGYAARVHDRKARDGE